MGIFSRLTDIVNSNLNALLDRAEDPEKMVRLIIQEMEETLVEVRTTSARAIADRKELLRRREWLAGEVGEWERKARVALSRGREDLARAALVEKQSVAEDADRAAEEVAQLEVLLAKLGDDIGALQAKIADARARQQSIIVRGRTATSRLGVRRSLSSTGIDDAMQRFAQYERRIDDLEGQVEAYDLGRRTLAGEIAELESSEHIDAELSRLKRDLAADTGRSGAA
jgi:phage shock protein A